MLNFEDACKSHVSKGVTDQVPKAEGDNSHPATPKRQYGNAIAEILWESVRDIVSTTFSRNKDGASQILAEISRAMYGISRPVVTSLTDDRESRKTTHGELLTYALGGCDVRPMKDQVFPDTAEMRQKFRI